MMRRPAPLELDFTGHVPDASGGDAGARVETLAPGAVVLRGFALEHADEIGRAVADIAAVAPFRRMTTPGNRRMSVEMTNCGPLGWVSDHRGYRYSPVDPESGRRWPPMPHVIAALAARAADEAGFRSEEHTSELQSREKLVCRLLLEKKKKRETI